MKRKSVKRRATDALRADPRRDVKKIDREKPSLKKPTGPSNVVAEPTAWKTEPYSMPLSSLCWTGH